ncbi:MAG: ribonuclease III [Bacilli bacterium]|jgi:ribonuclease-3|nr:ribonuclease III [Bacilli bacterium]
MAKPRRKYLNKKLLNEILAAFELETTNYKHYMIALTHSTYANENNLECNERIEFLGDAILGLTTAEYIYHTYPEMPEGKMTKLRATYVCEDANFSYAKELKLDELLLLGVGEEAQGGRGKKAIVADLFECFLGATYLTFGLYAVKRILEKVVFPHIKKIDNEQFIDYKTKLQEYIQTDHDTKLQYIVINEEGKPNEKVFTMQVLLDGIVLGEGVGTSKKLASQQAAKCALEKLAKK